MVVRPATFVGVLLRDRITIADAVRDGRAEPAKLHGPYLLAEPVAAADGDDGTMRHYLEECMAEPGSVAYEREDLRRRMDQLDKALATLRAVTVGGTRARSAASASVGRGSGGGGADRGGGGA